MSGVRYAFKEALVGVRHAKTMTALALGTIAMSLLVFGLFMLLTTGLYGVVRSAKSRIEIEAYLASDCSKNRALALKESVENVEGVERVVYVSKEDAAAEFTRVFGDGLLAALSENPLPMSLKITPEPGFRTAKKMAQIAQQIRSLDANELVDDLDYGASWVREFDLLLVGVGVVDVSLAVVVGLASVLVVSNAVRLSVLARREVIEIMRLVGATDGFIRRPFFLEGVLEGALGGAIAAVALYGLLYVAHQWPLGLFEPLRPTQGAAFVPRFAELLSGTVSKGIALLVPVGAVLGAAGSQHSLRRILAEHRRP